jgi:hypothetical protein
MNAAFPLSTRISQAELPNSLDEVCPRSAMISPPEMNESLPVNDISDQIREAVLHLQRDLDRVTARVRSLEVSALSGSLHNSLVSDHMNSVTPAYPLGEEHQIFNMLCCNILECDLYQDSVEPLMDRLHLLVSTQVEKLLFTLQERNIRFLSSCQHFMESKGSFLCSQESATGCYPEPITPSYFSKIHFYTVLPPTSRSS